ncbi:MULTISPECIES: transporter substrate-binding domain-containing protein [unclassified Frigoribacterium]|uniref:ABC transporter substrate-binding protein n=1 Tax=unclassified Frigoribacterium TaxID=2627005 RepID=UPI000F465AF3|nr:MULTISPECIES: transporter substrate-binding domain-containing protein [unclassified Frigoribacterium]MBD8140649.1 amino acid ABC transporter substrate-binding protein [Frigoribacterium sp. CFBP 13605]NQW86296.1 amino acid ABC transporter substrate-binding protein [Frigoribacterium sp. VKM Ac-2860]NQX07628.1 amino acid ABC transporter substrate-binding protein [Frigoribacterium sp. VKM Ac-2859]ROS57030.1 polar amino acid transport system substrate-binding protein [Frigoribacterium sp. PhB118]
MRRPASLRLVATAAALVLAGSLAACSSDGGAGADGAAVAPVTDGKITVATGEPAYGPWVEDDDPTSGKGYEAAVAYAVAEKLGYDDSDVVWVRTTFDEAIAPGPKTFDLNLQQFSITDQRKKAVDFSPAYYETRQAVVTLPGTSAADATSIADLKGLAIGAQSGTTSFTAAEDAIDPEGGVQAYNSNDDAKAALEAGQVDAIVLDVPTATYFVEGGVVLGQLPATDGASDQLGIVLPLGSSLTADVTKAVDDLRADGTLAELQKQWLADYDVKELS